MGSKFEKNQFSLATRWNRSRSQKKRAEEQKIKVAQAEQKQKQDLSLADTEEDIARRRFAPGIRARGSLIQTSASGLKKTLGG